MPRKMSMKRNVFIMVTTMTFFTAVYFTLFNHPPAEETLIANMGQSKRRPEWMERTSIQEGNGPQETDTPPGKVFVREANNTIEKFARNPKELLEKEKNNNQLINKNEVVDGKKSGDNRNDARTDNKEKENALPETDGKQTKEVNKGIDKHGIKYFDWDKWISDKGFVSVGTIWAFCDEPNPPVVGAALLMADDNGGIKIVTVMNTTFDNSILFGTIAIKVEYGGVKLYSNEFPVCDLEEEDAFFTCPMKAGDQYYMREDRVPGLLPAGNYYTEAKLIDHNQRTVVCANCDLNIK